MVETVDISWEELTFFDCEAIYELDIFKGFVSKYNVDRWLNPEWLIDSPPHIIQFIDHIEIECFPQVKFAKLFPWRINNFYLKFFSQLIQPVFVQS